MPGSMPPFPRHRLGTRSSTSFALASSTCRDSKIPAQDDARGLPEISRLLTTWKGRFVDPHRPGHELRYHPGETNLRLADVCVVNKVDSAPQEGVDAVVASIREHNPRARIVLAASPIHVEENGLRIEGKRVLAVEDGPTLTHGEMAYGAAVLAAKTHGAAELVDPRPFAVGSIAETYERYPHIGPLLPAMGYGRRQMEELRETIARSDADLVLIGTPIDLRRLIELDKPALRVTYRLEEVGEPTLADVLAEAGLTASAAVVA